MKCQECNQECINDEDVEWEKGFICCNCFNTNNQHDKQVQIEPCFNCQQYKHYLDTIKSYGEK
ncbi:MAG: hypothetical protein BV457_07440 [Thermoplasmata archaeon M9B1D]|nr:MAG: hypothetical protein BV457_07440 [Thermoplasmata archaeon M9B1D]